MRRWWHCEGEEGRTCVQRDLEEAKNMSKSRRDADGILRVVASISRFRDVCVVLQSCFKLRQKHEITRS